MSATITLTPGGHALGHKNPRTPHRELHRHRLALGASPLPDLSDMLSICPPVIDQGSIGSCTGCSAAGAVGILSKRQINDSAWTGDLLIASPLGIYYCERQLDGTVDQDAGASIADAVNVLMNTGVVTEADWPYDPSFFDVAPTAQAMADAAKVKLADAAPIDHDLDTIRACLAMGFPVQIGIHVFSSFESAQNGDIPLPDRSKDGLLGGHAIVLVGYDHTRQKFVFRNSWGQQWGNAGYGTLPYAYVLDADLNVELYVYRRLVQLAA